MCVTMTIGQFSEECLLGGKNAQETLDLVKKVFPNSQTSLKCIYYYSSKLHKEGKFGGLKKTQVVNEEEMKKALKSLKAA